MLENKELEHILKIGKHKTKRLTILKTKVNYHYLNINQRYG